MPNRTDPAAISIAHRLPLMARRLVGLLSTRDIGLVVVILLAMAIWFDRTETELDKLNATHTTLEREVGKMSALAAKKTKIQAALVSTSAQVTALKKTAMTAAQSDEAVASWRTALQPVLTAHQINDGVVLANPTVKKPAPQTVALEVDFTAVPDQVTGVVNDLSSNGMLARIVALSLKTDDANAEKLAVKLQIEAMYFLPDAKRSGKTTQAKL